MTVSHSRYLDYLAHRHDVYEEGEYDAIVHVEIPITVDAKSEGDAIAKVWEALQEDHPEMASYAGNITSLYKDGAALF